MKMSPSIRDKSFFNCENWHVRPENVRTASEDTQGVGSIIVAICIMIKDECNSSETVNNGSHMQPQAQDEHL